jgi:hypothetical protein
MKKIQAIPQGGQNYSILIDGVYQGAIEAETSFDAAENWCIENGDDIDNYDVIE